MAYAIRPGLTSPNSDRPQDDLRLPSSVNSAYRQLADLLDPGIHREANGPKLARRAAPARPGITAQDEASPGRTGVEIPRRRLVELREASVFQHDQTAFLLQDPLGDLLLSRRDERRNEDGTCAKISPDPFMPFFHLF